MKIAILNLMPKKIETETQLLRVLSNSPLQVDIELLQTESHVSRNTSEEHLLKFYKTIGEVENDYFDGMIITGAPVEQMPFEEVDYWRGTLLYIRMVEIPRLFHLPHLLGGPGGPLLPLRGAEI